MFAFSSLQWPDLDRIGLWQLLASYNPAYNYNELGEKIKHCYEIF